MAPFTQEESGWLRFLLIPRVGGALSALWKCLVGVAKCKSAVLGNLQRIVHEQIQQNFSIWWKFVVLQEQTEQINTTTESFTK